MKAFWYEQAGSADVIAHGSMPMPEPRAGEVRVRLAWSAVNITDVKRRRLGRELAALGRIVPNNDGSGVIDAVGEGVPAARCGERVWLFGAQAGRAGGTAAQFTTVPSAHAIPLPDGVSLRTGACLGVPAVTAHHAVFGDGPVSGSTILVTGGTGRVGACAVQLAKWAGARVLATAGSAAKAAAAEALGADLVTGHDAAQVTAAVEAFTGGAGVDRIVDTAFSRTVQYAPDVIRPNGTIATYASDADQNPQIPFGRLMYRNITIRAFSIYALPDAARRGAFSDIGTALAAGRLSVRVAHEMRFDDVPAAHALMESGPVWGSIVIRIADIE